MFLTADPSRPTELSYAAILLLEELTVKLVHDAALYKGSRLYSDCETDRFIHWVGKFPNGYGFSLIKGVHLHDPHEFDDLWEIAVLDKNGDIKYDTPITGEIGVWSYLSEEEALSAVRAISKLPPI